MRRTSTSRGITSGLKEKYQVSEVELLVVGEMGNGVAESHGLLHATVEVVHLDL